MPTPQVSYPRQEALTRRFRLGAPRGFRIAPDGSRIAFIRSSGGRDPIGSLWVAEPKGRILTERCAMDAASRADGELPEAEKARRERMRETTSGITSFSTDRPVTQAAYAVDGIPFVTDLVTGDTVELPHPGPAVDPQMSPDGRHVAYVVNGAVYAVAVGAGEPVLLGSPAHDDESWGLADFIAAEELERHRGMWWLPDSKALLIESVDESDVAVHWISDPARPQAKPRQHRYPAAGTRNALVRLFRIGLDGSRAEVTWDHDAYPYLETVSTDSERGAVVSLLSRDQRDQRIMVLAPNGVDPVSTTDRHCDPWITIQTGVPRLAPDGSLLEIIADIPTDTFRFTRDGVALTPPGLQVSAVVSCDDSGAVILAAQEPEELHVLQIPWSGELTAMTQGTSVNSATVNEGGSVVATVVPTSLGTTYTARLGQAEGQITTHAEIPLVTPAVAFHRVTDRRLPAAVLWPTDHVSGTKVPVVMAPYGGPHHNRVVAACGAFAADQWLADQGFAVIVVDGSGTPGLGPRREFEVSGDLATGVLADQVAALQELSRLYPDLDLARVGITGWSFGGYLAALAVLDRPDVFHAAVAGAPVTDWALYDTGYTERYLGLPQEHPQAYETSSLLTRAAKLTRPLLLIHGLADDNVLAAHTLQLSTALLAAGRAHQVLPLSGVTHMTPQEIVAENLLLLQVAFLKEHLA